jgi:endonuclease G
MYSEEGRNQFKDLVEKSKADRDHVRKLVREGRWREAEPDRERYRGFTRKKLQKTVQPVAESIQGDTIDFQGVSFLTEGAQVRRSVAYVEVNTPHFSELGSGFLVSPRLFLTNQHVIRNMDAAHGTQIIFDRELDELGIPRATTTYLLDPDTFALFSDEEVLDYALIAVGRLNAGQGETIGDFGCCPLSDSPDKHVLGMNVNIIQHPRALPKMISIRNNLLTHRTDRTLLYETDTDQGSSGSPVFNDEWDLVALHHYGGPFLEEVDDQGLSIPKVVNEGIRISAIYRDLQSRMDGLPPAQRDLLKEVFAKPVSPEPGGGGLLPPHPGPPAKPEDFTVSDRKGTPMEQQQLSATNELRVVLPIEIIVRVGSAGPVGMEVAEKTSAPKMLTRGAEAIKVDRDYENRTGYEDDFIPGYTVPLPKPNEDLKKQVAPLRTGEPDAEQGELKYEHFSIKMNKSKRMAMFTATNIDGETYLTVDRKTGEVTGSEGETWFKDSRISESFFIGQSFYSDWSDYFDRGHLTRRTDPTWGTKEEAERANADTYHFTNCSPQHFRFNETTKYWQGAERYVLENGLFATGSRKHICVFQGPLFDDQVDRWADDVQVPSSFFKVIAWAGANGLKAVGLIVDQLSLLSEKRKYTAQPTVGSFVDVTHWRVAISQIEKRTGLEFGEKILDADTISAGGQPVVGAEAARPLRSFADILA